MINGTTTKLTLYIKNLIQAVEDKIANSTKLIKGADTWTRYKNDGLATVADRIGFHKCIMGIDPPAGTNTNKS